MKKVIPFYQKRFVLIGLALAVILICSVLAAMKGIELDIEFKGGSLIDYNYEGEVAAEACDQAVSEKLQLPVTCQLTESLAGDERHLSVSVAGNEALTPDQLALMTDALNARYPDAKFEISSSNLVNPSIGGEMLRNGLLALVIASLLIIAYVWFSFRSMSGPSAGVTALISLFHDITLASLAFVLMGAAINETLIAVVLTILGFSINNTIVIYDRVRENFGKRTNESLPEIMNKSITESLSRSLNTSLCIFAAVAIALGFAVAYNLQGIIEFAVPILVGTVSGTFSSVCLSGPLWVMWKTRGGRSGFED